MTKVEIDLAENSLRSFTGCEKDSVIWDLIARLCNTARQGVAALDALTLSQSIADDFRRHGPMQCDEHERRAKEFKLACAQVLAVAGRRHEIRRQLHPDLVAEIARTGTVTRETHGHLRVVVEEQYGSGTPGWWRGEYLRGVQVRNGPGPDLSRAVPRRPLRAPDATSRCRSVWVEPCPAEVLRLERDAKVHLWRDTHPTPESGLYGGGAS